MSKATFNQLVRKLIEDTNLLLNISTKMSSDEASKEASKEATDDDDDDVTYYNGKKYYYHPPQIGDKVEILWSLSDDGQKWYAGKVTTHRKRNKRSIYTITYDSGKIDQDYLSTENFPKHWRFAVG
tara:strand:+ start:562 stop:939 length:378 start_codon:yes stop_codon:yes gene_type:complete